MCYAAKLCYCLEWLIVTCGYSLPIRSQPPACINKRLLCPSLASTLRNPILPKVISKRKFVGLDEPNFDEDVKKKRPDAGQEYDPNGDYIYDARKYFNPEKYRKIIANQEEKRELQQESRKKFYYRPVFHHRRHYQYHNDNADTGHSSVINVNFMRERLSSPASFQLNSEYPVFDVDNLEDDDIYQSSHQRKAKKKSKHSKHRSRTLESSHKHATQKKSKKKRHKKKHKHKKSDDKCASKDKLRAKLQHRSQHRSKLFSSQEPRSSVTVIKNSDFSHQDYYLDHNSIGNDGGISDLDDLPDDRVSGWKCYRSPQEDNNFLSDNAEIYSDSKNNKCSNYAKRPVVANNDASDVWDVDSSLRSEHSDADDNFSATDDENNQS